MSFSSRRMSDMTRRMSIDIQLTQRVPAFKREHTGLDTPPQTPGGSSSSYSTPTTPQGHPLSQQHPFAQLLGPRRTVQTPLPVLKIVPLCVARVAEGVIFAVIFPYVNEMMREFGVPENALGIWSATAESIMMVTEAMAAPLYAPLADRYGRRPVFLILLAMWGAFAFVFGFASTPWGVVSLRAALGLLAGAGVLSRTMCGELCDRTNRIQGFAMFSPSFTVGVTIAPLIGGFLSRPVPRLLSPSWTLFVTYPYLLPSVVAGGMGFASAAAAYVWLPETLPVTLHKSSQTRHEAEKAESGGGLKALLLYPKFQNVLILYGLNNGVMFSWEAVYPLFAFTNKNLGGLGLSTQQIGVLLAVGAALSIVMTIWLFPVLHRTVKEGTHLRLCLLAYPLAVSLFPVIWALNHGHTGGGMPISACVVLGVQLLLRRTGDFASTLLDTIVLDAIPGPEYLAMANSITFSMAAVGRAIGPFIVSSAFSLSAAAPSATSPMRQFVWFVFALVCVPSLYMAQRVTDDVAASHADEERHGLLDGSAIEDDEE